MEIPANFERVTTGIIKKGDLLDFGTDGRQYACGYIGCSVRALGFKVYRKIPNKKPAPIIKVLQEENAALNKELENTKAQLKTSLEVGVRTQKELALLKENVRALVKY